MDLRIYAELSRNGLVTRRYAVKCGLAADAIDRLVRSGAWVAVWRGVYASTEFWTSLEQYVGRPLYRARAASAHMLTPHVMSHDNAALELGLSVLETPSQPVHVTRFGVVGSRHRHGVKHHKAPFASGQIVFVDGRPVLDAARTVADISRDRGLEAGVVTADSALRMGVARSDLVAAYEPMTCWPYITVVREVVSLADGGAESPGETLLRLLILELGIGQPETQFGLSDGGRSVFCDLRVGRHIFEFDGRVKYVAVENGGLAKGKADDVLWDEKTRRDFVQGFRLGMSRVVWADLCGNRRVQTKQRLRREFEASRQLFGDEIEDLAPFIVARDGRRFPRAS